MEQVETHIEHVQEEINHHAQHGDGHGDGHGHGGHGGGSGSNWIGRAALSAAIIAALAAISGLLAGYHAEEQMLKTIEASNKWAYYQAKGIKSNILASKMELLGTLGKDADPKDKEKIKEYKNDQDKIFAEAKHLEAESEVHGAKHTLMAYGVTLFQVAIAIVAVSVLSKRKAFWYVSLGFAIIGIYFLAQGLMHEGHHGAAHEEHAATPAAAHAAESSGHATDSHATEAPAASHGATPEAGHKEEAPAHAH